MNPYPFEALNHFTVPCSFTALPHLRGLDWVQADDLWIALLLLVPVLATAMQSPPQWQDTFYPQKKAAKFVLAAQSNEPKGKTRATNAKK
jgi:hypothetical protein